MPAKKAKLNIFSLALLETTIQLHRYVRTLHQLEAVARGARPAPDPDREAP